MKKSLPKTKNPNQYVLDKGGIRISPNTIGDKITTFQLKNVSEVNTYEIVKSNPRIYHPLMIPSLIGGFLLLFIGLLSDEVLGVVGFTIGAGMFFFFQRKTIPAFSKTDYYLDVIANSGNKFSVRSKNKDFLLEVKDTIHKMMEGELGERILHVNIENQTINGGMKVAESTVMGDSNAITAGSGSVINTGRDAVTNGSGVLNTGTGNFNLGDGTQVISPLKEALNLLSEFSEAETGHKAKDLVREMKKELNFPEPRMELITAYLNEMREISPKMTSRVDLLEKTIQRFGKELIG